VLSLNPHFCIPTPVIGDGPEHIILGDGRRKLQTVGFHI